MKRAGCRRTLASEVEINLRMDHPNVVRLFDFYEDFRFSYLVLEACEGGELLDRIAKQEHFCESDTVAIMSQLLKAVRYMHAQNVAHRDLKLDNLLLQENGLPLSESTLKVIDFGCAKPFGTDQAELKTIVGTSYYVAPEVLKGGVYTEACDLWSSGVILYMLLSGTPPFDGADDAEVVRSVKSQPLHFPTEEWACISQAAKDLVSGLCERDTQQRLSAECALGSPWCLKAPATHLEVAEDPQSYFAKLRRFSALGRFKKAAVHLIAHRLDNHQIKALSGAFGQLDQNHDGVLSMEEMQQGCRMAGIDNTIEVQALFKAIDTDLNGKVDYTEFIAATMDHRLYLEEELCWEAFRVFDKDGNGEISVEELREVLAMEGVPAADLHPAQLEEMLRRADSNGDGRVCFDEFVDMLRGSGTVAELVGSSEGETEM